MYDSHHELPDLLAIQVGEFSPGQVHLLGHFVQSMQLSLQLFLRHPQFSSRNGPLVAADLLEAPRPFVQQLTVERPEDVLLPVHVR